MLSLKQEILNHTQFNIEDIIAGGNEISDAIRNSIVLYNKAIDCLRANSEDIAIINLKKALTMNPGFKEAHNLLGLCYLLINDNNRAVDEFKLVAESGKASIDSLRYLMALGVDDSFPVPGKARNKSSKASTAASFSSSGEPSGNSRGAGAGYGSGLNYGTNAGVNQGTNAGVNKRTSTGTSSGTIAGASAGTSIGTSTGDTGKSNGINSSKNNGINTEDSRGISKRSKRGHGNVENSAGLNLSSITGKSGFYTFVKLIAGFIAGFLIAFIIRLPYDTTNEALGIEATPVPTAINSDINNNSNEKYEALKKEYDALMQQSNALSSQNESLAALVKLMDAESLYTSRKYEEAAAILDSLSQTAFPDEYNNRYNTLKNNVMPVVSKLYYDNGRTLLSRNDINGALDKLTKAARYYTEAPYMDGILYNTAKCYQTMGDNINAMNYYSKVTEQYPNSDYSRFASARYKELQRITAQVQPSGQATAQTDSQNGVQPTVTPFVKNTARPSGQTTTKPSGQVTSKPSVKLTPTSKPSVQATAKPSVQATAKPSVQATSKPLVKLTPTSKTSGQATAKPSVKLTPTAKLPVSTTNSHTSKPSVQATAIITTKPTDQPIAVITPKPSPTEQPLPESTATAKPDSEN